jgi:hypothetical protein
MTVQGGSEVQVRFDRPVSAVVYANSNGLTSRTLSGAQDSISLGRQPATGSTEIAVAARPWEKVGAPTQVSWFPPSRAAVMATIPAAGGRIAPATAIHLTFSRPVSEVLGSGHPRLSPRTAGRWSEPDSHTLVFTPSGFGASLGSQLRLELPREVAVAAGTAGRPAHHEPIEWTVPPGSILRLQQLLAQAGYLPVDWRPVGRRRGAHAERRGAGGGHPSEGQLQLALSEHPAAICGRCGPRARRT